jgi:multidrug resistance efflux pump
MLGSSRQEIDDDATPRERRIFITYGLLAAAFSFWFLGFFLFRSGSALAQYQGIALILVSVIFLHRLRRKIGKFLPIAKVKFHPVRSTIALLKRPSRAMMALVAVIALLFVGRLELKVPGDVTVLPIHNADVRTEVDGIVEEIPVYEGQQVRKGDLIARLSDWDYRSELRKVEAEIQQKQAKLQILEAGSTHEEIELARREAETAKTKRLQAQKGYVEGQRIKTERLAKAKIAVKKAEERLKFAQNNLNRFKAFWQENIFSRRELEDAEEQAAVRQKELEEAKAELQLVLADELSEARTELAVSEKEAAQARAKLDIKLAGSRKEEVAAVKADIALSAAQKQFLEEQISRLKVVSPITGVVATPNQQLREMTGQLVKKGDLIAKVYDLKTITAKIPISEKDIADVKAGQKVALKFRGYPQQTFHGEVTSVAASADDGSGGKLATVQSSSPVPKERTIFVTTVIDNSSLILKPEMTGKAKVLCGKHTIFDLMKRGLARALKVEFWSWW